MENAENSDSQQVSAAQEQSSQTVFEQAARRLTDQPDLEAHLGALGASLMVGEYQYCRQVVESMLDRWNASEQAWIGATRAWEYCGDLTMGIRRLHAHLEGHQDSPILTFRLAEMLESSHQLNDAEAVLSQLESDTAVYHAALFVLARIRRRRGDFDGALRRLNELTRNDVSVSALKIRAGYELARTLDQAERYEEAFKAVAITKQWQANAVAPWQKRAHQSVAYHLELANKLDASHLESSSAASDDDVANYRMIFLGGFPRSGTTLIESTLSRHSQLLTLEETPVFNQSFLNPLNEKMSQTGGPIQMLEQVSPQQIAVGRETYLRRGSEYLDEPMVAHRWVDKNPILTPAAPFFLSLFPLGQIVACIRDPRDVLVSNCFLPISDINTFNVHHFRITDLARWQKLHWECLMRLRAVAPERVHLIAYEDVVNRFEDSLAELLEFLGLQIESSVVRHAPQADDQVMRSPSYSQVTQPIYTSALSRWKHYEKELEPALRILDPVVEQWESLRSR